MSNPLSDSLQNDFEDFFEQSLCGYLILSPTGAILRANMRMSQWTGFSNEKLKGLPFSNLLTIGGKVLYETHLFPLLRMQGYFDEVAVEINDESGKRLRVLINAYERKDADNNPLFIRLTVYKASERHLYEQGLIQAKNTAENELSTERGVAKLREQFIAVLGHDLRNPVGGISAGAMLLLKSSLSARDKNLIAMIGNSAARMTELIENIMDFARSRMGDGIAVNLQPTFMEPSLLHVVEELRSAWPERVVETEFQLSTPVICDAPRISQLLSNLLANALSHGAVDGPIIVRAKMEQAVFELSVSNAGIPIPAKALERLFEPFTREEAHASQSGLGLGLYIASEIARAHKGKLSVTSTEEETRFTFAFNHLDA